MYYSGNLFFSCNKVFWKACASVHPYTFWSLNNCELFLHRHKMTPFHLPQGLNKAVPSASALREWFKKRRLSYTRGSFGRNEKQGERRLSRSSLRARGWSWAPRLLGAEGRHWGQPWTSCVSTEHWMIGLRQFCLNLKRLRGFSQQFVLRVLVLFFF